MVLQRSRRTRRAYRVQFGSALKTSAVARVEALGLILEHDDYMNENLTVRVLTPTRELQAKQERWRRAIAHLTTLVPVCDAPAAACDAAPAATDDGVIVLDG